jgi:hypothetical protein
MSQVLFEQQPQPEEDNETRAVNGENRGFLTDEILSLLNYYREAQQLTQQRPVGERIKVGDILSSVAKAYERLRYAVDYKKEHLVRRNAIERILKRQLRGSWEKNPTLLSESLIKELIWARYIKNDYYPPDEIGELAAIIAKYLRFIDYANSHFFERKEIAFWRDWLISLASCEIEESLDVSLMAIDALSFSAESWFEKRYDWEGDSLSDEEKKIQLTIAVHRGLFRSDDARTAYHLLKHFHKNWRGINADNLDGATEEIFRIFQKIRESLGSSVQARLYRFVQKQISAFQILKEVIEDDPANIYRILLDKPEFEERIYEMCQIKYSEIRARVSRGIVRSIVYIFVTKILFAIIFEIPYEYYFLGGISIIPLATTIAIPLLFVFLVGVTIKRPGESNTQRIIEKIFDFVYVSPPGAKHQFSLTTISKRRLLYRAFVVAYGVVFLLTFAGISYLLYKVGFNIVGGAIFFVFISLVLLFGYRVKFTASELNATSENESFLANLFTNVTLPLLDLGVWLSDKFAQLNFLIVFLDFMIEAPLKNVLGVADEWTAFVRERRQEVVEVPGER